MIEIERYKDHLNYCARMASEAATDEIRELWLTIERSYRFLLERAERLALETRAV